MRWEKHQQADFSVGRAHESPIFTLPINLVVFGVVAFLSLRFLIGALLPLEGARPRLHQALDGGVVGVWELGAPLVLTIVAVVFVPIRHEEKGRATLALRAHYFLLVLLQGIVVLWFASLLLRMARAAV